jgi:6-phosphogluconate dehydrogenase
VDAPRYHLGMVGLGVMGRNLVLNMVDHGFAVAGYDKDPGRVETLRAEAGGHPVGGATRPDEFASLLRLPRAVMMLVPAGPPVDAVIRDLLPYLAPGDLLIDGGNSFYRDTDLRAAALAGDGLSFLGVGVSGGEHGARHGPSMMPGGPPDAYERVRPIFETIAAHVDGDPCVTYVGRASAGHYVKMVHNGIEYGLMQSIAETYDLMKRGLGLDDDALAAVYDEWNRGELNAYLIEITSDIFRRVDERTGRRLVDVILDVAGQKGTGMWTSQNAMELQTPVPTIDMAVAMRDLSAQAGERRAARAYLGGEVRPIAEGRDTTLRHLRHALYAGMIITYAQGMALLRRASSAYDYGLNLEAIARIWRGGCIIRAAVLDRIRAAFRARPDLPNLLLDPSVAQEVLARLQDLRTVVRLALESGIPAPALAASLAYVDGYRSEWLPANLIQAQRDYFGAHTYERLDMRGIFHTEWSRD